LAGFGTYEEQGLRVVVGGTIERLVTLKVAAVAETVTVSGATPMGDPRKPGVASNIEQEGLKDLPISRFAIYEFTKWTVRATPNARGGTSGAVSVMGAADSENSVLYDSQNSNTPMGSSAWQSGIADTVGEVQVITLGASAEYQVAQGAVVNVIFKSGTNQFRADASGYWYPDRLISKPILRPCNCRYGQTGFVQGLLQDYAAELGGPIVKDHLWFWNANKFSRRKSSNPGTNPDFAALWFGHGNLVKPTWQPNARLRFSQTLNITYWDTPPSITVNRPLETINHGPGWTPLFVSEMNATLSSNTFLTARYSGMTNPDHISYPFTFDVTTPFRLNEITNI